MADSTHHPDSFFEGYRLLGIDGTQWSVSNSSAIVSALPKAASRRLSAKQSATATRFMEKTLSAEEPGFISLIVLVEVVWVLASSYSMVRSQIAEVVEALLTTEQLRIESSELVWRAKRRFTESKADFSDTLIAECASAVGCRKLVTFDRGATTSAGFELLA